MKNLSKTQANLFWHFQMIILIRQVHSLIIFKLCSTEKNEQNSFKLTCFFVLHKNFKKQEVLKKVFILAEEKLLQWKKQQINKTAFKKNAYKCTC